jgi:hypothetical protein
MDGVHETRETPGLMRTAGMPELEREAVARIDPADESAPEKESLKLATSASRCPYCHADVTERGPRDWVACEGCLARHHASCWKEHRHCASCHGTRALVPRMQPTLATRVIATSAIVVGVGCLMFVSWFVGRRSMSPTVVVDAPQSLTPDDVEIVTRSEVTQALLRCRTYHSAPANEVTEIVRQAKRCDSVGRKAAGDVIRAAAKAAVAEGPDRGLAVLNGAPSDPNARDLSEARAAERDGRATLLSFQVGAESDVQARFAVEHLVDAESVYRNFGFVDDANRIEEFLKSAHAPKTDEKR